MVEESAGRDAAARETLSETETKVDEGEMETETKDGSYEVGKFQSETGDTSGAGGAPLDLGGLEGATSRDADDFVLDLDLDEAADSSAYQPSAYVRRPVYKSPPRDWQTSVSRAAEADVATADQFARTQEFPASVREMARESRADYVSDEAAPEPEISTAAPAAGKVSLEGLSPDVIDAIARRAVEHLSDKVIREIAWEVVPDLAELLIKRQLEENKT